MNNKIPVDIFAPLKEIMPEWCTHKVLFLMKGQWLSLAALILVALIIERLTRLYMAHLLEKMLHKEAITLSKNKKKSIVFPLGFVTFSLLWLITLPILELPQNIELFLVKTWDIALTCALVWTCYNLVEVLSIYFEKIASQTENKIDDILVPMARKIGKVFVIVFGIIFIGNSFSFNMKSIIAGLGIGGLAFALAAKETISNLFGSFTVLIDQPFQIGDYVKINDKIEGTVEEVGLRSTKVRTLHDSLVCVPNGSLINANVDNFGKRTARRFDTKLQLSYSTPREKIEVLCEEIRGLIMANPLARKDNFHVYLNNIGSSNLEVLVIVFWEVIDYQSELSERHRFIGQILNVTERLGLSLAFPTQTMHVLERQH